MRHHQYITIIIAIALCCTGSLTLAQTGYVQTEVIKAAGTTTESQVIALSASQKITTRAYTDGQGRTIQTVVVQASPLQKDIVQPIVYDNLGSVSKGYLPYVSTTSDGSYRTNALSGEQQSFYAGASKVANDDSLYSRQVFENSPLQRLLRAGSVGNNFQPLAGQHFKSVNYRSNATGDYVINWGTDAVNHGYYGDQTLDVTDGTDEDNAETLVFKNREGQLVLKRQVANQTVNGVFEQYFDTYYVYNQAGAISNIIQPKAIALMQQSGNWSLAQTSIANLIFSYAYDDLGRLVQKTTPGGITLCTIYDPLNRPVLMQDANLRANNQWNYIKYDIKGHAISQGIYTDTDPNRLSRSGMQTYVDGLNYSSTFFEERSTSSGTGYYTNNVFPTSNITDLAYSYYDDYDLNGDGTADYSYQSQGLTDEATPTAYTRGMSTMVRSRTVGQGLSNIWLTKVVFYDKNGRAIQVQGNNQLNSSVNDIQTSVANFVGVTQRVKEIKVAASVTTTIQTEFTYDHMFRITAIDQSYNGASAVRIASYEYNELGQMVKKNLHQTSSAYLQSLDYRYNIRGQLLSINNSTLSNDGDVTNGDSNDIFGMQIMYDTPDANLGATASYSGRISAVKWMTKNSSNANTNERSYKYTYDSLNRLTAAEYAERSGGSGSFNLNQGGFDESGIKYDENGNLLKLQRNTSAVNTTSHTQGDDLTYSYNSGNPNLLQNVADGTGSNYTGFGFKNLTGSTSDYSYDGSGNLTADPYKGMTLSYNVLHRTDQVTITTATGRYITYTYGASGQLLRKQAFDNNTLQKTTDYIDGFVYENSTLVYCAMPEGRLVNVSGTLKPEYVIKDNQGNARFSFRDDGSGGVSIVQENSFYAFGLAMANSPVSMPTVPNRNLYNGGSEWQNDYGDLPDLMQTYYRNYDAALGRFVGTDPMPESAESMTGYNYAGNNPVLYNDPMGDELKQPFAMPNEIPDIGGKGGGGPNYKPNGPGSGNYWSDGIFLSDWSSMSGSDTFRGALAAGNQYLGGATFYNPTLRQNITASSNGTYSYYTSELYYEPALNGRIGTRLVDHSGTIASQGGHSGYDTDPSTIGHNWFWSVYIGPNNPMSYNKLRYDYSTPASGFTDLGAYFHDKNYDRLHITGPMGVFTETKAIGADYQLIGTSLGVFANPWLPATPGDRLKGLAVGVGIFIGTLPKVIAYPVMEGTKNIPSNDPLPYKF